MSKTDLLFANWLKAQMAIVQRSVALIWSICLAVYSNSLLSISSIFSHTEK
jgi:hypothetical protein